MEFSSVIIASIAVIGFVILFGFEISSFNKTGSKKYSFLRFFPYELNCFRRYQKSSNIYVAALVVLLLMLFYPYIIFSFYTNQNCALSSQIASYTLLVLSFISLVSFALLSFTKLTAYKFHLVLAIVFSLSIFASTVLMILFYGTNIFVNYTLTDNARIISIVVGAVALLFEAVLICNPTYKTWAKVVSFDSEDSNERPKFSYLCMLEWGSLIAYLINVINLFVITFI